MALKSSKTSEAIPSHIKVGKGYLTAFTETEKYEYPRVRFQPIKEVSDNLEKLASSNSYYDLNEGLYFKQLKCDGKLIKQTFLDNQFS